MPLVSRPFSQVCGVDPLHHREDKRSPKISIGSRREIRAKRCCDVTSIAYRGHAYRPAPFYRPDRSTGPIEHAPTKLPERIALVRAARVFANS
jgi:hypothetical protein